MADEIVKFGGSSGRSASMSLSEDGTFSVTGADGTETLGVDSSGNTSLSGGVVLTPAIGGNLSNLTVEVADLAVNTGGAATTITLNVPDGALIFGVSFKIATEITGIDSTTGTLAFTGGSTTTAGTVSAFTAGETITNMNAIGVSGAVANAAFTLSGGADNTPSGGTISVVVHYWTIGDLD